MSLSIVSRVVLGRFLRGMTALNKREHNDDFAHVLTLTM